VKYKYVFGKLSDAQSFDNMVSSHLDNGKSTITPGIPEVIVDAEHKVHIDLFDVASDESEYSSFISVLELLEL
jgi:hypothetical protein